MSNNNSVQYWVLGAFVLGVMLLAALIFHQAKLEDQASVKYYDPGVALYNKGDYTGAKNQFRLFLAHIDGTTETAGVVHYRLGLCLLQEGKYDDAKSEFQSAIFRGQSDTMKEPDAPEVSQARAALAWMQQNPNWQSGQPSVGGPPKDFPVSTD